MKVERINAPFPKQFIPYELVITIDSEKDEIDLKALTSNVTGLVDFIRSELGYKTWNMTGLLENIKKVIKQ